MHDLVGLISGRIRRGESLADIEHCLLSKGYTQESISTALVKYYSAKKLSDYIEKTKGMGHDIKKIRPHLLKHGHSERQIQRSIELHTPRLLHRFDPRLSLVVILASVLLVFGAHAIFPLVKPVPSKLLDYEITPVKKSLAQGSALLFNAKLLNFGKNERFDVFLEHIIKDTNNVLIDYAKETVAIETQTSKLVTIPLPEQISPGVYIVVSKARYGDAFAESSFLFEVNDS